jgi:bifunctional UDP-N-acetylglucosamine pyrophosphorylase/glucosamine-1-phosphate N-acetyltransferase
MSDAPLACLILAGGKGTRMRSRTPKLLHQACGRPLLRWPMAAVEPLAPRPALVVVPPAAEELERLLPGWAGSVVQPEPRGTGDAVLSARTALEGFQGDVLVLNGDHPLLDHGTLEQLVAAHRRAGAAATVLTFERTPSIGADFGRVVCGADGKVERITELRDASPAERELVEVNSGYYVFRAADLWEALERIRPDNDQGELYLTDAVGVLAAAGRPVHAHHHDDPVVAKGINTRADLAEAEAVLRGRINHSHMLAGVTIRDPASTFIDADVRLESDVTIEPFTVLRGATTVAQGAVVGPHVVAVDARIGSDVNVGPFCYLRPGAVLERRAKAGTFVEIKNAVVGVEAKVPHLSYIGDAEIGEGTNIGAGNITANFDGERKQRTVIGRNVRTGSDNVFVAPVQVGDGAYTGAGSVITNDVPPDALGVARAKQTTIEGYGKRKRRER